MDANEPIQIRNPKLANGGRPHMDRHAAEGRLAMTTQPA